MVLMVSMSLMIVGACTVSGGFITSRPSAVAYVRPIAPGSDYVWISGDWIWAGNRYEWQEGHWVRPRAHRIWVGGQWESARGGWRWRRGHWR